MLPVHLLEWNRTEVDYPRERAIAELFSQQVARTPNAPAVVARTCQLTYRELDARSSHLAEQLQSLGVNADTLVGVAMGRSNALVVSLLAILKAGGAYVPLDPAYPKERLNLIIEDSGLSILLTTSEARDRLPINLGRIAVIDVDEALDSESTASAPQNANAIKSSATGSLSTFTISKRRKLINKR